MLFNQMLVAISLTLSLLCVLVYVLMFMRVFKRCKRTQEAYSFTDLLDYANIGPQDTIIMKNGGLLKIFEIKLPSYKYQEDNLIDKHQTLIANAIKNLGGNFTINFDVIRDFDKKLDDSKFYGNDVAKKLVEERKQVHTGKSFNTRYFLSITLLDSVIDIKFIHRFLLKKKSYLQQQKESLKVIDNFNKKIATFKNSLENTIELVELTYEDNYFAPYHGAVDFIKKCISGNVSTHVAIPRVPFYLDAVLSTKDFTPGMIPKIGDKYVGVIAIDSLPNYSLFGILSKLSLLNFEYRFTSRYITFDKLESNFKLEKFRRLWSQKRRGMLAQCFNVENSRVNLDAVEQLEDINDAKKNLDQNENSFGSYSANIIFFTDDLKTHEKLGLECVKVIEDLGFGARIETYNATDAYIGSFPGHSIENMRRNLISNSVFTDLLPLDAPFTGEFKSPNQNYGKNAPALMEVVTKDGSKAYLNLHEQDLGNSLVVGPPGTGKSVFLGSLIPSFMRYQGMKLFVFDKGNSFYALTKALQGNHINLDAKSKVQLCPLYHLESALDIDRCVDFVKRLMNIETTSSQDALIYEMMTVLRDETISAKAQGKNIDRSLSYFNSILANQDLTRALTPYLNNKDEFSLLDGKDTMSFDNALNVFECGSLMDSKSPMLYPVLETIFDYINREVVKAKAAAIIIDEAWMMLSHSQFAKVLLNWLKTLRKHNVVVVMATQSIHDFAKSNLLEDILDCVKTRIYLPNIDAKTENLKAFYQKLNVNDKQLDEIYEGTPKQDLFIHKSQKFMPFNLVLSKKELKLLSLTHKDKAQVDNLYSQFKEQFYEYL